MPAPGEGCRRCGGLGVRSRCSPLPFASFLVIVAIVCSEEHVAPLEREPCAVCSLQSPCLPSSVPSTGTNGVASSSETGPLSVGAMSVSSDQRLQLSYTPGLLPTNLVIMRVCRRVSSWE